MKTGKVTSRRFKTLCILGSLLLLAMAIFHGSGFSYINKAIIQSNTAEFLKDIVPVLFAHPSFHLIGLAAFGVLALFLGRESKKVLVLLSLIVIADGLLAFYLGGVIPGILLVSAALCFTVAGYIQKRD